MVKLFSFVVPLFLSCFSYGAADSVAIFHRPEKVIILINENYTTQRIRNFLGVLGGDSEVVLQSLDSNLRIQCRTTAQAGSCHFRFLPAPWVEVTPQSLQASLLVSDLKPGLIDNFEMNFESASQDVFSLKIINGRIHFHAQKK